MLQSFMQWLPSLQPREGEASWSGLGANNLPWRAKYAIRGGSVRATLEHPSLGVAIVEGKDFLWTSRDGKVLVARLHETFPFTALSAQASVLLDNWKAIFRSATKSAAILDDFDGSVTVLVIPGLSVFGARTPALEFEGISLPPMTGDISLRNIALDLMGGHVALCLRMHGVDCVGNFSLRANDLLIEAKDPSLWMAVDAVIPMHDATTRIQIDRMELRAANHKVTLSGPSRVFVSGSHGALSVDGLALLARKGSAPDILSGRVRFECIGATGSLVPAHVGPITADEASLTSGKVEINARRGAGKDWQGMVLLDHTRITLINPSVTDLPGTFAMAFDPARPPILTAMQFGLSLPALEQVQGHAGVRLELRDADINLAGLRLLLPQGGELKCDASVVAGDLRVGMSAKAETAVLRAGGKDINLYKLALARFEENISAAWGIKDAVLERRAINELSLIVELPQTETLMLDQVRVPLFAGDLLIALLELSINLGDDSDDVKDIVKVLKEILKIARNFDDVMSWLGGFGSILGIRIESIDLVLKPSDVRISLDPSHTNDRTLGFRVETGLDWVALDVSYSYPDPKWDDWGNRSTSRERIARVDLNLAFPDLIVKVDFAYDSLAKKFRLENIGVHLEYTDISGLNQVGEAIQKIIQGYFGVSTYTEAIIKALNVNVPDSLPVEWDVSALRIEKTDVGGIKGLRITLRALENVFNP